MATYDLTATTPSTLAVGDVLNIPYSGACITISLPKGTYKLEAWGAYGPYSSASPSSSHTYGYGGYASGTLTLTDALTLYCYVGGTPLSTYSNSYYYGGWNGGGSKVYSSSYRDNGPGGGATDFCLVKGSISLDSYYRYVRTSASYLSRLLVAGGGGGGRTNNVQSQGGYCPVTATATQTYAGGMTATGSTVASGTITGAFGYGGTSTNTSDDRAAGGGGWYGGTSAGDRYGGGGSSFAWCDAYASYVPSGYSVDEKYKLTGVSLLLGSSNNCPAGVTSDGYARVTVVALPTPPDTPTSFAQSGEDCSSVTLTWDAASGAAGYKLYRDGTLIATQTGTGYVDTGLSPSGTYAYTLTAYNDDGESDPVTLTATTKAPPSAPENFRQTGREYFSITLAWDAVSDSTGYKLYRDGTQIAAVTGTAYTDGDVLPNQTYAYTVETWDGTVSGGTAALTAASKQGYIYKLPVITAVTLTPNPAETGAELTITAEVSEAWKEFAPEYYNTGEIYAGEW